MSIATPQPPLSDTRSDQHASDAVQHIKAVHQAQLTAHLEQGPPDLPTRLNRLDRFALALSESAEDLVAAVNADFGNRPSAPVFAAEIAFQLADISSVRRHLRRWMQPRRPQPRWLRAVGVNAWVEPTPRGVVGIISPWNFPIALAVQPATAALAAGNRVMIKPSELTPRTALALQSAFARRFAPDELAVVLGGKDVGAAFSTLPLDHLFFTGSPAVAKHIQRASADNLTSLTFELGGKNPTIVGRDANLKRAAQRIVKARLANSGQICLSPDFVFVPRGLEEDFVAEALRVGSAALQQRARRDDVCTIIDDRNFERLQGLIADAQRHGGLVHELAAFRPSEEQPNARRFPFTIVTGVTAEMALMQHEIFGPVLPVLPFDEVDDVIDFINARPAPLAAYWFGPDSEEFRRLVLRTRTGGVTRNDFALHAALPGLPFGGVGYSGSGYYHGRAGFDTFSHLRSVAVSPRGVSSASLLGPPFPEWQLHTMRILNRYWGHRIANRLGERGLPRG